MDIFMQTYGMNMILILYTGVVSCQWPKTDILKQIAKGRFSIYMLLNQYSNFHHKDNEVSQLPEFYNGNPNTWENDLDIQPGSSYHLKQIPWRGSPLSDLLHLRGSSVVLKEGRW